MKKGENMKTPKKLPKQRNPIAEIAFFKSGAGAHQKTHKASRRKDKVALKKGDYSFA